MSKKHLNRYAQEFAGRQNTRPLDTIDQMRSIVRRMVGKQLKYDDLASGVDRRLYWKTKRRDKGEM